MCQVSGWPGGGKGEGDGGEGGATEETSVYWQYLIAYIGCSVHGAWLFIFFKLCVYVTHTFL